jgi:hypothetical protein
MRYFEATMPAIAPIEDLRTAQKDLLEAKDLDELKMYLEDGGTSDGRMCANCGYRNVPPNN